MDSQKKVLKIICETCGNLFPVPVGRKGKKPKYCSEPCRENRVIDEKSHKEKMKFITMKNGLEIRDDLMGRYITDRNYSIWTIDN